MSRVLIDTQALIWFAEDADELSLSAKAAADDPATMRVASVASIWEMAIKIALGKLKLKNGTLREFVVALQAQEIEVLPIFAEDAMGVGDLPQGEHTDPFDRLIAAQCLRYDISLISVDKLFDAYNVRRIW